MSNIEIGELSLHYDDEHLVVSRLGAELARFANISDPHDLDNTNPAYVAFIDGFLRRYPNGSIFVENTGTYLCAEGSIYYQRKHRWETDDERAQRMANGGGVAAFVPLQGSSLFFK